MRRAGQESGPPLDDQSNILRMKCIDIFQRVNRVQNLGLANLFRQRQLHDWDGVFAEVAESLCRLAANASA